MPRSSFGNCSLVPFHKRAITSLASIVLSSLICCSLFSSSLVLAKPTTPNGQSQTRGGRPEPGPPAATLPNLDQVRREHPLNAEPPAAQPSVIRARRKSLVPRNGRTVSNAIQPNFSSGALSGIANGQSISVLTMVGINDGSYYKFGYTSWN